MNWYIMTDAYGYISQMGTDPFAGAQLEPIDLNDLIDMDHIGCYRLTTDRRLDLDAAKLSSTLLAEQNEQRTGMLKQRATLRAMELQVQSLAPTLKCSDDVILLTPLLKPWVEGSYSIGDIVSFGKIPKRCVQAHNSIGNPMWNPKDAPSLWAAYHGSTLETALPYEQPLGAHDAYKKGEIISVDSKFFCCNKDGVVYPPSQLPSVWDAITG